ncbi:unnamed protein product [Acanthosepion pharaonis]|uniref:Uncharacterized protein n=1 Tax=Acanthosepion pharaonis TaxID=158019 RepID=A0A812C407_ACAPH|nr:unnamed protein product [Sepia pharaonis]
MYIFIDMIFWGANFFFWHLSFPSSPSPDSYCCFFLSKNPIPTPTAPSLDCLTDKIQLGHSFIHFSPYAVTTHPRSYFCLLPKNLPTLLANVSLSLSLSPLVLLLPSTPPSFPLRLSLPSFPLPLSPLRSFLLPLPPPPSSSSLLLPLPFFFPSLSLLPFHPPSPTSSIPLFPHLPLTPSISPTLSNSHTKMMVGVNLTVRENVCFFIT